MISDKLKLTDFFLAGGNACERRQWRMQRAEVGAAVEILASMSEHKEFRVPQEGALPEPILFGGPQFLPRRRRWQRPGERTSRPHAERAIPFFKRRKKSKTFFTAHPAGNPRIVPARRGCRCRLRRLKPTAVLRNKQAGARLVGGPPAHLCGYRCPARTSGCA